MDTVQLLWVSTRKKETIPIVLSWLDVNLCSIYLCFRLKWLILWLQFLSSSSPHRCSSPHRRHHHRCSRHLVRDSANIGRKYREIFLKFADVHHGINHAKPLSSHNIHHIGNYTPVYLAAHVSCQYITSRMMK